MTIAKTPTLRVSMKPHIEPSIWTSPESILCLFLSRDGCGRSKTGVLRRQEGASDAPSYDGTFIVNPLTRTLHGVGKTCMALWHYFADFHVFRNNPDPLLHGYRIDINFSRKPLW